MYLANLHIRNYRVFVCDNMAFHGDFTPVLAKHTKHFSLVDAVSVGVDRMQRNFEPMRCQVETWRQNQIGDPEAKLVILPRIHRGRARGAEAPRSASS
jgi:hypothetical protein